MSLFQAFILGIVEGLTEFLPVSSTGHIILAARLLRVPDTGFVKSFEIIIQLGAITAVAILYFKSLYQDRETAKRVLAAFIPTGIIGFLLYKSIKKFLLGNTAVVLWSLAIGGIFIILFEIFHREDEDSKDNIHSMSYMQAVLIGIFQALAVIPGVSRSATTIIGGLILGLKRKDIVEFSFLLAVPTMAAACVLDIVRSGHTIVSGGNLPALAMGFITSLVVAIIAIKSFLAFIQKHSFIVFGVYRIIIAVLFLLAVNIFSL